MVMLASAVLWCTTVDKPPVMTNRINRGGVFFTMR